jgi:hypothetical protein
MANINLVTSGEKEKTFGTGTSVLLVIFFVVVMTYVFLYFYGKKQSSDLENLKLEYADKVNGFTVGNSKRVLDFQNRLELSTELLAREKDMNTDLGKIEEVILAGVYLDAYVYNNEARSITLDCFADSYETVAKQILSFKSEDYFSSVLAGETKFDTKSKRINFPVVVTIK